LRLDDGQGGEGTSSVVLVQFGSSLEETRVEVEDLFVSIMLRWDRLTSPG
jgi:hypothetical protein